MKKILIFAFMLALISLLAFVTSCEPHDKGEVETTTKSANTTEETTTTTDGETTTVGETTTEETTEGETTTAYNYMNADLSEFVSLDPESYKSFEIVLPTSYEPTDEVIDREITGARFYYKEALNDGQRVKDQAIEWGDTAYIFYCGFLDGVPFEGGSNMGGDKPYALDIGSGSFIDGFEEGLIGVVPNQTSYDNQITVKATFPENYKNNESLSGKEVEFKVYVVETVKNKIPDLDEKFITEALKYPIPEGTEDAISYFKNILKEAYLLSNARDLIYSQALEQLVTLNEAKSLPEEPVKASFDSNVKSLEDFFENYHSQDPETYPDIDTCAKLLLGLKDGEDWRVVLREKCERDVKLQIIIYSIAKAEGYAVTDEEARAEAEKIAEAYPTYTADAVIEVYGGIDGLKRDMITSKVYDLILSRTNITYSDETPTDAPETDETNTVSE